MKTSVFHTFCICSILTLGLTTSMIFANEDRERSPKKDVPGHPPREKGGKGERAERGNNPRTQNSAGKHGDFIKSFRAVDTNSDEELTFEEFSMMGRLTKMDEEKRRKLFDFLDRNKDGKLHIRELQPREPSWVPSVRKNFSSLDVDKNDRLNLDEFSQASSLLTKPKEMVGRIFSKMDRNKDQLIERSELKWSNRPRVRPQIDFVKYDLNQSGGLDFEEYSKLPFMVKCSVVRRKQLFERIDADKNREISSKEVKAAHKTHKPFGPHGKPPRGRGSMRDGKDGERKSHRHGQEEPKKGKGNSATVRKSTNV